MNYILNFCACMLHIYTLKMDLCLHEWNGAFKLHTSVALFNSIGSSAQVGYERSQIQIEPRTIDERRHGDVSERMHAATSKMEAKRPVAQR